MSTSCQMYRPSQLTLSILVVVVCFGLVLAACNDSVVDEPPPDENDGDPVFQLADIDGSWQQEDEQRRYLDILSTNGDDGLFYEAFFQDDPDQFDRTDCYVVVRNEVVDEDEGQFTIRVFEEGQEPRDVSIEFQVQTDDQGQPARVRMIKEGNEFDAWFRPSTLTLDDFEPRCEDLDEDENEGDT